MTDVSESPYTVTVLRRAAHVGATGAVALDVNTISLALTVLDEMRDPIAHPVAHVFFPKYRTSVATGIPFGKVRALSHIDAALRHSWGRVVAVESAQQHLEDMDLPASDGHMFPVINERTA